MSLVLSVMFIKLYFTKIVESDTFIMKRNYYIKKALYTRVLANKYGTPLLT